VTTVKGKKLNVVISSGNIKLKIPNVSLPPITSCINYIHCMDKCYALKSFRQYPGVRNAWTNNYRFYNNNQDGYFGDIHYYVSNKKPSFFRWHVSGEIQSQEYLDKMADIARDCVDTTFLAYTKYFDLDYSNAPNNLNILFSMFPTMSTRPNLTSGVRGYFWCQDGTETRIPSEATKCHGKCNDCLICYWPTTSESSVIHVYNNLH
jgi:hypothetical protein